MCVFITAVVPADTDLRASRPLLGKYGMSFKRIINPFIEAQLVEGELFVRATRLGCDCDSILGSARNREEDVRAVGNRDIEKLRKKGWSQEKIERWLSEKSRSITSHHQKVRGKRDEEITRWQDFIGAFLSEGIAKRLGLLMHDYNGLLEEEQFRIESVEHISLSKKLEDQLITMNQNVLYWFH
jgi:hypothetical protein